MSERTFVHESSIIDEGVTIGDGARIYHFCHISEGATIGSRSSLGQNVYIGEGVDIGRGVKIQNNVSVYAGVSIEDDVFLGPSCVFTNIMNPRAFVDRRAEFRPTRVKRGATVGANATILCGITIGEYALIGAGTVVLQDIAPYALVVGNPGRVIGRVDKRGETIERW